MVNEKCRDAIIKKHGFRIAYYGEKKTHAICSHGVIASIHANHHICIWTPLVKKEKEEEVSNE